jgi:hypothetical protein
MRIEGGHAAIADAPGTGIARNEDNVSRFLVA